MLWKSNQQRTQRWKRARLRQRRTPVTIWQTQGQSRSSWEPEHARKRAPRILLPQNRTVKWKNYLINIYQNTQTGIWLAWLQKMRMKSICGPGLTNWSLLLPEALHLLNMMGFRADRLFLSRSANRNGGTLKQPGVTCSPHFHPHFTI